jgi:limonene-1,2-epoxide hydrolase
MFAEGWALPKPDPFLDYFLPLISPDATFRQPMFPDAHGLAEIEQVFRQLFALFPDFTATVRHSAVTGNVVFVESGCSARLGRKIIQFDVCDRFVIEHGLLVDRRSFADPRPALLAILRRPASWPMAVRACSGRTARRLGRVGGAARTSRVAHRPYQLFLRGTRMTSYEPAAAADTRACWS